MKIAVCFGVICCVRSLGTAGGELLHPATCSATMVRGTAIILSADFFEKSCGIAASFGPAPLEIFVEAIDFCRACSGRFALGKTLRRESSAAPFYVPGEAIR
jgi:hypothetical protein